VIEMNMRIDPVKNIVNPPKLYVAVLVCSILLHLYIPFGIASPSMNIQIVGVLIICASALLARCSFLVMRNEGISASLSTETTTLAKNGPFALTRNPIYVAMTGLYIGFGFVVNSIWSLLLLFPILAVMHWGVILREEVYLSRKFGAEYESYRAKVRRWL
jgi:protein-S-isoprenylcysteine O-methyltransferase Ste14